MSGPPAAERGGDVLAIVGPTASGKSALAMDVARSRGGVEIVALDAFTIYRGMDIGTAKPSVDEREQVPHHLIDLLDPSDDVSVAWFQQQAREAISGILARQQVPLLVGGSGLYFRAVVDDLRFPPTDDAVRSALEDRWEGKEVQAHAELARRDPEAAGRIQPGNLRRSIRALEVIELTGELFSSFAAAWDSYRSIYPGLRVTYLEPDPGTLRARIDRRARAMVDSGLLGERKHLGEGLSRTAAQAIGYQEAGRVLSGELPIDELADAIAQRTWNYARRQRSWFRRDPRCQPPATADDIARLGVRSNR